VAVLLDCLVTRGLVLPSLMAFLDPFNWWPGAPRPAQA
jgi:uncharacterized membrane protein YdfJ with MMPL/SSD domain